MCDRTQRLGPRRFDVSDVQLGQQRRRFPRDRCHLSVHLPRRGRPSVCPCDCWRQCHLRIASWVTKDPQIRQRSKQMASSRPCGWRNPGVHSKPNVMPNARSHVVWNATPYAVRRALSCGCDADFGTVATQGTGRSGATAAPRQHHGSTYGSQPRSVNSLSTAGCPLPQPGHGCCAHSSVRVSAAADVASRNLRRHTERLS